MNEKSAASRICLAGHFWLSGQPSVTIELTIEPSVTIVTIEPAHKYTHNWESASISKDEIFVSAFGDFQKARDCVEK